MTIRANLIREVKRALTRAPENHPSERYAVYVPGSVVIGTFADEAEARDVAGAWKEILPEVIVVDRGADK